MGLLDPFDRVVATFEIVTPMFLGDADKRATRFRPESLKSAWRFWWRATRWPHFLHQCRGDYPQALAELQARQGRLFGAAADKRADKGQSPIRFRPVRQGLDVYHSAGETTQAEIRWDGDHWSGLRYLGYGLVLSSRQENAGGRPFGRGEILRSAFRERQEVEITLGWSPRLDSAARAELLDALEWMGLLGGLGSRWRNGFGSFRLKCYRCSRPGRSYSAPSTAADYQEKLRAKAGTLGVLSNDEPPITAFSGLAGIDVVTRSGTPLEVLNWAGQRMHLLRSSGYGSGRIVYGSCRSLELFENDHRLAAARDSGTGIPERVAFGSPHNCPTYDKLSFVPARPDSKRRASPLLLHVQPLDGEPGRCALAVTILPAEFVAQDPANQMARNEIRVEGSRDGGSRDEIEHFRSEIFHPDWSVLRSFLEGRSTRYAKLGRLGPASGRVTVLRPAP